MIVTEDSLTVCDFPDCSISHPSDDPDLKVELGEHAPTVAECDRPKTFLRTSQYLVQSMAFLDIPAVGRQVGASRVPCCGKVSSTLSQYSDMMFIARYPSMK